MGSWCGGCYRTSGETVFPVRKTFDDDGVEIVRDDHATRFLVARDGDHLMVPFQCELCLFRNLHEREPLPGSNQDRMLLDFLRRANLDAFWSRESSTVKANLCGVIRVHQSLDKFELPEHSVLPKMGPYPIEDSLGAGSAVTVLDRSLDPGKHEDTVQFATFRKIRACLTNLWQASIMGLKDRIGAYEKGKLWISECPTHSFWFGRFMEGIHRRVGELVKQDEPISIELLVAVLDLLETRWQREMSKPGPERDTKKMRLTALTGLWFCAGFCAGLRGEEMPLLEFEGTFNSLKNIKNPKQGLPPHFTLMVSGPTKGISLLVLRLLSLLLPSRTEARFRQGVGLPGFATWRD